jgi:uncharacterized iron-regulated membrane protein
MAATKSPLYYFFWRWHFYAGLMVTPIVIIMAITGGLYLLQPQIEGWMYAESLTLAQPYEGSVDHDAVIKAAKQKFAVAMLHSYQPPTAPNQSAQLVLTTKTSEKITAFLHPKTHALLGSVNEQWRLMNIARELHKNLMLGITGRVITELTACWLIVMIGTGFVLWWPRADAQRGRFIPNTQVRDRKLWREVHAIIGAWVGIWVLALLLTGLPWSLVWGGALSDLSTRAGEGFPKAIFAARPVSTSSAALPEISMNALLQSSTQRGTQHAFKIEYPWWENGSYALMPLRHGGKSHDISYMFFDRRSGEVMAEYRWQDLGKIGRLTALGVAFHEGRLFGTANQMLNLTAVVGVITLIITGCIMWWKRKPHKALGVPRLPKDFTLPYALRGGIVLVGVMLPLFGASVLVLWLLDAALSRFKGMQTHA